VPNKNTSESRKPQVSGIEKLQGTAKTEDEARSGIKSLHLKG